MEVLKYYGEIYNNNRVSCFDRLDIPRVETYSGQICLRDQSDIICKTKMKQEAAQISWQDGTIITQIDYIRLQHV